MIKAIIFDIDGTLVDAYAAIEKSLNYTLKKFGCRKASMARVKRTIGSGDRNFVASFVDAKDVNGALAAYRKHHEKALLKYSKPLPCAHGILRRLKSEGYKLAIVSNRPTKYSHILLKSLGLKKYFELISCADNKKELKPNPKLFVNILKGLGIDKKEAVYVGDMVIDIIAGRNAGVKAIALLGGSSYKYELEKARPFKIIKNLCELERIIR